MPQSSVGLREQKRGLTEGHFGSHNDIWTYLSSLQSSRKTERERKRESNVVLPSLKRRSQL